ncbi:MAG: hypothetical protein Q8K92_23940, partial [Leadbetterella sp.]|nr:hypothetical protein [Leadbetterella sp.]
MFNLNAICLAIFSCCWFAACGLNKPSQPSVAEPQGSAVKTGQSSIVQKLKEFDHLPVEERIALYYKLKKESPDMYNFKN